MTAPRSVGMKNGAKFVVISGDQSVIIVCELLLPVKIDSMQLQTNSTSFNLVRCVVVKMISICARK